LDNVYNVAEWFNTSLMKRKKQHWRERINLSGLRPSQQCQPYFCICVYYFYTFSLFNSA